jgi:hypothetical protein
MGVHHSVFRRLCQEARSALHALLAHRRAQAHDSVEAAFPKCAKATRNCSSWANSLKLQQFARQTVENEHEFKIGGLTAGANVGVAKMSAGGLQLNVGSASGVKVSMK